MQKLLELCYSNQQKSLGIDNTQINTIVPEERIATKIIIQNPKKETYPYKSLLVYFEQIINLYNDKFKYKNVPVDIFLKKTLFCGIYNSDNSLDVNYVAGNKNKTKIKNTKSKKKEKY